MLNRYATLIRVFFTIIFSITILTSGLALASTREVINLNGMWDYAYGWNFPTGGWTKVEIPSFISSWKMEPIWFKTTFASPENFKTKQFYLSFQGIKYASQVWLNGTQLVKEHTDGFTPFEVAIPVKARQRGNNDLVVQVFEWRSAIAQYENYSPKQARDDGVIYPDKLTGSLIYPVGSQIYMRGIWQSVKLVGYPEVRIQDVFIKTLVKEQKIQLEVTLENMTNKKKTVKLNNDVLDNTQVNFSFLPMTIVLGPNQKILVNLEQTWADPTLWSLDNPHLYQLKTYLSNGDEKITRFGFREFSIENGKFYLNGTPINLRATAAHPFGFSKNEALIALKKAKAGNNVIMRLHSPWISEWYEAADEVGMLIVWESAYWCYGQKYCVEDAGFWTNFKNHLDALIRLHRNHPSIVIWSLENELLLTGGDLRNDQYGKPIPTNADIGLSKLIPFVKAIDDTRPIMFEGDGDPKGSADILSLHYPHEYPKWNLWPDEAWWLEYRNNLDWYPWKIPSSSSGKPLYIGEFLWVEPEKNIEGSSIFFGDAIYKDLWDYHKQGKAEAWRYQIEAYRALDVQGICPWNIWEEPDEQQRFLMYKLVREKFAPNGLYLREKNQRFFSGGQGVIRRTAYLFNELPTDATLVVTWELKINNTVQNSSFTEFELHPAEIREFIIGFKIKPINAVGPAVLSYQVKRAGNIVFSYEEKIQLYQRQPIQTASNICLYADPLGETKKVLDSEKINCTVMNNLSSLQSLTSKFVIISCDKLINGDDWQKIKGFVHNGGRVLILRQEEYPDTSLLRLASDKATIAFPRRPSHPILKDIDEDELRLWASDNIVVDKPFTKPDFGLYKVLIDSGSVDGLKYAGLMEMEFGKGTILFSQLDIIPKLGTEPAARKFFQNILNYLASYQSAPSRTFQLLAASPAEQRVFKTIGFDINKLQAPSPNSELIFANDGLSEDMLSYLLDNNVKYGSTLWLHKPSDALIKLLPDYDIAQHTPQTPQTPPSLVVRVSDKPEAEGLTSYSLNWTLPHLSSEFAERVYTQTDFSGATVISPSHFAVTAQNIEAEPDYIKLNSNGYLTMDLKTADIKIEHAKRYNLGLEAEGTPVKNEYPMMRVQLNGKTLGFVMIGPKRGIYSLTTELTVVENKKNTLKLEFVNDQFEPPEDRNVIFYNLEIKEASNLLELTQPAVLVDGPYRNLKDAILLDGINWETSGNKARKQEFLVSLLTNLGVKLEPPSAYKVIEAEKMDIVNGDDKDVKKTDSGVWFFSNKGRIETTVKFAKDGKYLFRLIDSGTPAGGVYPKFKLTSDNKEILLAEAESYYSIEVDVEAGNHLISISFTNDYSNEENGEDRNLFVDRLVISEILP